MERENKNINGCLFGWKPKLNYWSSPHNDPGRVREVQVVPPAPGTPGDVVWKVVIPSTGHVVTVKGEAVEDMAFNVAESYTRQQD